MTLTPARLKEIEEGFNKANRAVRARLAELAFDENAFDRATQDFYQIVRETHWHEFSPTYQYEILVFLQNPESDFYQYVFASWQVERRIEQILAAMNRDRQNFNAWINTNIFPPVESTRFKKEIVIADSSIDWIERHADDKAIILAHVDEIFVKWQNQRAAESATGRIVNRTEPPQLQSV